MTSTVASMPSPDDLMALHLSALFTHDWANRLVAVNEPSHDSAPRCFVGRTSSGVVCRTRFDVAAHDRDALENAARSLVVDPVSWREAIDGAPFRAILGRTIGVTRVWSGPAFAFPPTRPVAENTGRVTPADVDRLRPHFEGWIADVLNGELVIARMLEGRAVAVCATVRRTSAASEAGVETAAEFRGRGYAAPSACEWARCVRAEGLVPLYSTSWTNTASRALAQKLGLVQFGSDLHLT